MNRAVSIAILTYKRHQHLVRALRSARVHATRVAEIIVVDNAAEPELERLLKSDFPDVHYIAAPSNGGCEGRNIALRAAATPIVITIDDDVELSSTTCIDEVEAAFAREPLLACLNFTVADTDGHVDHDWCHPRPVSDAVREFETYFIMEGASALDRVRVLEVGGYEAVYFLGHEGVDLAFRLIRKGYRVLHTPRVSVTHYTAAEERPGWRLYYYYTRNGLWNVYRSFPPMLALGYAIEHTAKMAFVSIRAKQGYAFVRGFADALRGLPALKRECLDPDSLKRVRAMKSQHVALAGRIQRHLRERIL
jgi:GT2 family glycosyltransferase